jgi:hypothetical protein
MRNMAEARQMHKGTPSSAFSPLRKWPGRRIKAYGFGLCGSVFRNVLQPKWTTGCAQAQWCSASPQTLRSPD